MEWGCKPENTQSILSPLPPVRFAISKISTRKVYHDCHIYVDYNYYSVPYEYMGKIVDIEITESFVKVFCEGKRTALHKRIAGRRFIFNCRKPLSFL